jgi:hypothetical protein
LLESVLSNTDLGGSMFIQLLGRISIIS